jgi:Peptidase S46
VKIFLATVLLTTRTFLSSAHNETIFEPWDSTPDEISFAIKQKIETDDPARIKLTELKLKYMSEEMKIDPAAKSLFDSTYARMTDSLKFYDSELAELLKNNAYDLKKNKEMIFQNWAKDKPEFENIINDFSKTYTAWRLYSKHRIYLNEGIAASPLLAFAGSLQRVENALVKQGSGDYKKAIEDASEARKSFLLNENKAYDQNYLALATLLFYQDIPRNQQPIGFYEGMKGSFGDLKLEDTYNKFVRAVFSNTMIFNEAKWKAFVENPDANVLQEDPAFSFASTFLKNWQNKYLFYYQQFIAGKIKLEKLYQKACLQVERDKVNYPEKKAK